jgi:chromosome segregation ATPase
MADLRQHITSINTKLQQLLKRYEVLQKENDQYRQTVASLQKGKEDLQHQLDALQQQNLVLKAGSVQMDEADKKDLEKKINAYLRNIDKCISILSQ